MLFLISLNRFSSIIVFSNFNLGELLALENDASPSMKLNNQYNDISY